MPELKLNQLKYESDTWKRLLSFMMDENTHLKNRLSEVLKNNFDNNLLDELENFQSRFIKKDETIGLLRNDLAEVDKLLFREIFEDAKIAGIISRKLKTLRNNLVTAELTLSKLKLEFNDFLSGGLDDSKPKNTYTITEALVVHPFLAYPSLISINS